MFSKIKPNTLAKPFAINQGRLENEFINYTITPWLYLLCFITEMLQQQINIIVLFLYKCNGIISLLLNIQSGYQG